MNGLAGAAKTGVAASAAMTSTNKSRDEVEYAAGKRGECATSAPANKATELGPEPVEKRGSGQVLAAGEVKRVGRDAVYSGHLLLVNREQPVRDGRISVLRRAADITGLHALDAELELETTCLRRLESLLAAADAKGDIVIVSGYRSLEEQTAIYEGSLIGNGPVYTANYVALPGCSEHQTGLAVDVGERIEGELDFIAPSFPDQGACAVFKALAPSFGFIQRYKEGKEGVTGIACEPWHFRYVGVPHAANMERMEMCLEEYIAYVKLFSYEGERLAYDGGDWRAEIYYVAASSADDAETAVRIPVCDAYTLSGDNVDGFIVTAYYGGGYVD